jgi:hypothetical protein
MAIAFGSSARVTIFWISETYFHYPSKPCSSILCHGQQGWRCYSCFSSTLSSDYCRIILAIYEADLGSIIEY